MRTAPGLVIWAGAVRLPGLRDFLSFPVVTRSVGHGWGTVDVSGGC